MSGGSSLRRLLVAFGVVCAGAVALTGSGSAQYKGPNGVLTWDHRVPTGYKAGDDAVYGVSPVPSGAASSKGESVVFTNFNTAVWSPDGNRALLEREGFNAGEIWLWTSTNGLSSKPIVTAPSGAAGVDRVTWSPDGSAFAYAVFSGDNVADATIWEANADGSNQHEIMDTNRGLGDISWGLTPNGSELAFGDMDTQGDGLFEISPTASGDWTDPQRVSGIDSALADSMQGFDWSPDGSGKIVFSAENLSPNQCQDQVCIASLDIYVADTRTGDVRNLTNTDTWAGPHEDQPVWSPDGTEIAYRADKLYEKAPKDVRTTPTSIWIMNADGSDQHQVSQPPTGDPNPLTDSDNVPTWQPCRPNVTTDCSAKSRSTNAVTTPTTKVPPLTTGTFGANCGVDKFDWYDATLEEMPERKRAESCIFLLSNSDAVEVLDKTLASSSKDATLTSMFGEVILAAAKSIPNAPLAEPGELPLPTGFKSLITDSVKDKIKDDLKEKGWHLLAGDIPEAIEAMDMIGNITDVGQAVGLAAVPIVGTFIIGEIQDDDACVQLDATVADRKLHVDWHLVYNPDSLSDPKADKGLTETWAASREVRSFAPDKLQSHGAAFACDSDGNVRMIGTGSGILEHPTHVVT